MQICELKQISQRLNRVFGQFETITDDIFLRLSMQYLVLSLESQVYYHIGDYRQTNWVPALMSRLARVILGPNCDHAVLLDFHPRLTQAYSSCLHDLKCTEHTFSSDDNRIEIEFHRTCSTRATKFTFHISFVVAIFWESCYDRGLSAARNCFC